MHDYMPHKQMYLQVANTSHNTKYTKYITSKATDMYEVFSDLSYYYNVHIHVHAHTHVHVQFTRLLLRNFKTKQLQCLASEGIHTCKPIGSGYTGQSNYMYMYFTFSIEFRYRCIQSKSVIIEYYLTYKYTCTCIQSRLEGLYQSGGAM